MRTIVAVTLAAISLFVLGSATAIAAPQTVDVRIEGKSGTLFDHTLTLDGHDIRAASDTQDRSCDGTNNGMNPTPGPTPTSVSVDAMDLIGEDFDGQWYDGFDDYFIQRFADDLEDGNNYWYWGVLVDGAFTPVGGCQAQLVDDNESLWAYDAFNGRPFLRLSGPATAVVGQAVGVDVISNTGDGLGGNPYAGAEVGGVTGAAKPVPAAVIAEGSSDADGDATVTFNEPGWHRLKATDAPESGDLIADAIPSNSIDVCVEVTAGAGCSGDPLSERPFTLVPAADTDPSITGEAKVGSTLTANPGKWIEYPTSYGYQWRRCDASGSACTPIGGATSATYTAAAEDEGKTLDVQVIATNGEGVSEAAGSDATDVVVAGSVTPPPPPVDPKASISIDSIAAAGKRGHVRISLKPSGAGSISVLPTSKLEGAEKDSTTAEPLTVRVKLAAKAAKRLERRGKAKLTVKVRFAPRQGDAVEAQRSLEVGSDR